MPKVFNEPTEPFEVILFKSDLDELRALYGKKIGVSKAIRQMVRSFVKHIRDKSGTAIDAEMFETE